MSVQAAAYDLIYLVGCAVNEITPSMERVEKMNLELVHELANAHTLTAITCMALEDAYGGRLPLAAALFKTWDEEKNQAIYKNLLFDAERTQLLSYLEESGIWYAPLKGVLLKDLYPKIGMRQMADNDILFDPAYQKQVHDWFVARGYEVEDYEVRHHDAYHKKPVYNFEMHISLFGAAHDKLWQDYYRNTKDRLVPIEGTKYGYAFTDEDFYIYVTTHACKHYRSAGTGLRSLVDCYVYNKAKGDSLDWEYIRGELDKLGIREFEEKMRSLSEKIFADPESAVITEEEYTFLADFLKTGTYGTLENSVYNKFNALLAEDGASPRRTKLKYIWRRLFPDKEFFRENYPFFYKHRWLMPVGYVYRWFYRLITHHRKLGKELRMLKKL